jgi:ubiquitin-like-conjugating enzyme ATG3
MDNLVNSFKSAALSVGEFLTPVLKESKFKETGVLTPEEFVAAGDFLVHHCPTWSWSKAVDDARTRSYLPADKQYLITKHVPCHRRCKQMEYDSNLEKILSDGTGETGDEWVDTHHFAPEVNQGPKDIEILNEKPKPEKSDDNNDEDDDNAPAVDMDAFMEGGDVEDDPFRYVPEKKKESEAGDDQDILRTRTYDLHITYDKYYQVPRLWLLGYNEDRKYLTVEQMNEDFSEDHANKTITIESHPHLVNVQMASIHPCRHAEVMKRLIEQLAGSGKVLGVHQYLLIFLKFVQAVIPTIEYDYTRSIEL